MQMHLNDCHATSDVSPPSLRTPVRQRRAHGRRFSSARGRPGGSLGAFSARRAMPYYEVLCLAKGRLTRRELGALATRTARAFMSQGGVVTRLHALGGAGAGPRRLAYAIRRAQVTHDTGFYFSVCAFASPPALREVCRRLRLDEDVLRSLPRRRNPTDAALPAPDADAALPGSGVGRADPAFELHQFLSEYERQFPDGQSVVAAADDGGAAVGGRAGDDAALEAVISNLRATTDAAIEGGRSQDPEAASKSSAKGDPGLGWLLNLDEKKKFF